MAHARINDGEGVPPAPGPYSPGVVAGDLCFLSGQLAVDPATGKYTPGTVTEESQVAMRNLLSIARAGGFGPENFLFVTVLLADMGDFAAFNEVYKQYWPPDALPARMAYQVGALPFGAKVEIQGVAAR